MTKYLSALFLFLLGTVTNGYSEVLIIADEFPAMRVVAAKLKREENIESKLVWQTNLPATLAPFQAVIVYIHHDLLPETEDALADYTEAGGKLVVLHHSIASGKRKNRRWFSFLGVSLPEGNLAGGGYKWIEGVRWQLVNLNPAHFIMTNQVTYPEQISYTSTNASKMASPLRGFTLENSEVYLNHVHTGPHTLLLGLKYVDEKTGLTYMQDTAGWVKPRGRGWIVYLMPGHTASDFEDPAYGRIVLNAVVWRPR